MAPPKEFKTVTEFKEFLNLLKDSGTRKATLAAFMSLPNKELDSAELARQAKVPEVEAQGVVTKLRDLGIVRETKPGRFRATRGLALNPALQRQLAALPRREQEDMLRLAFEAQRENLNTVCEFWKESENPSMWLRKWGKERPNLRFGMTHIPVSWAADVFRVMAKFEGELSKVLESKARLLGEKEVAEPVLLVQWLLVPTG